jgi:hypothetical protein
MKKWFQFYADFEDEDESVPMRAAPEDIKGFRRWTASTTMVFTTFGNFKVVEEYEKFSKRLFAFVNFEEYMKLTNQPQEEVTTTTKKYVVKVKKHPSEKKTEEELAQLQDYYDNHQPDSNAGVYV